MYGAFFITKALFEAGRDEQAVRFMESVWRRFDGWPQLPEAIYLGENAGTWTMCHGWSSAPAFLLPMYVLGLRPTAPGTKEALLAIPDVPVGLVPSAQGRIKTPYGELAASWSKSDGVCRVTVRVPADVTLSVKYRGKTYPIEDKLYLFE